LGCLVIVDVPTVFIRYALLSMIALVCEGSTCSVPPSELCEKEML